MTTKCFILGHDWYDCPNARDWDTGEPNPYRVCFRCDQIENEVLEAQIK